MEQKHIFLSPSNQNANIGYGAYGSEKQRMTELCDILGPILERCGFKVSRQDSLRPIGGRTAWANRNKVDFYLPVHSNAGGGSGPIMIYRRAGTRTVDACNILKKHLDAALPLRQNALMRANFGEIRLTDMVSPYAEVFFHDNKRDVEWYLSGDNKTVVAEALAKGVCDFMEVEYIGADVEDTQAPEGMIFGVYSSAWAGYNQKGALEHRDAQETGSFVVLSSDRKYRVFVPRLKTKSSSEAAQHTGPDSIVRLEAEDPDSAAQASGDGQD